MKKIITLFMAGVMALSLGACTAEPASTDAGTSSEAETSSSQVASEESSEPVMEVVADLEEIMAKGEMVIGYTVYEPMNYTDDEGNFTGFDTEYATAVCEALGVTPVFVEIDWGTKELELNAKSIDCIWNGLTIDPQRSETMSITLPYVKNAQVLVVKADSGITTTADLTDKTVVAEIGSAGEMQIVAGEDNTPDENLAQAEYVGMAKQTDCLLEVKAGTADAAVLDWTLAMSAVGEGTDYADLMIVDGVELATEEYGIAFRKGSDLTEKVNEITLQLVADGTLTALAEKYGLALAPAVAE